MIELTWIERLKCPRCGKTGTAELYEASQFKTEFRHIPDGFKVVTNTEETFNAKPAVSQWR